MTHIPFAALPLAEREALAEVLLRAGVSLRHVCISRMEPSAADGQEGMTTVTGAGWFRSYAATAGWIALLEQDLIALRPAPTPQPTTRAELSDLMHKESAKWGAVVRDRKITGE
jgi:hypothetical protein